MTTTEIALAAVADAVVGLVIADLSERTGLVKIRDKIKGPSPETVAFQRALAAAYSAFSQRYPDLAGAFFDDVFLKKQEIISQLSRVITPNKQPDVTVIEKTWKNQFRYEPDGGISEPIKFFVDTLTDEVKAQPLLKPFFDSRALDQLHSISKNIDSQSEIQGSIVLLLREIRDLIQRGDSALNKTGRSPLEDRLPPQEAIVTDFNVTQAEPITVPLEFTNVYTFHLYLWLASDTADVVDVSLIHELARRSELLSRFSPHLHRLRSDATVQIIETHFPSDIDTYITNELHHLRGMFHSYDELLSAFTSELALRVRNLVDKGKFVLSEQYLRTEGEMVRYAYKQYKKSLTVDSRLSAFNGFLLSVRDTSLRFRKLGFESRDDFNEFVSPTTRSISSKIDETRKLLYTKILEEDELNMSRFAQEGYQWDVMSEARSIILRARWGQEAGVGIVRLTSLGATLLRKKLAE